MTMPGFSAEDCLPRSIEGYRAPPAADRAAGGALVVPQARNEFGCRVACSICNGWGAFCGTCYRCYGYYGP